VYLCDFCLPSRGEAGFCEASLGGNNWFMWEGLSVAFALLQRREGDIKTKYCVLMLGRGFDPDPSSTCFATAR
jgi:hypothetical protein